jgi:hypothetical protein
MPDPIQDNESFRLLELLCSRLRMPEPSGTPQALLAQATSSSSRDQVEDQDDQRHDQQKVNQAAGNM